MNKKLSEGEILNLLDELNEYFIDMSAAGNELEYYLIEYNDKVKNILEKLGIDIDNLHRDETDVKEGTLEISPVFGKIQFQTEKQLLCSRNGFEFKIDKDLVFDEMLDVLEHFCWKVENGKAYSNQTYSQAREVLNKVKGKGYEPKKLFERSDE